MTLHLGYRPADSTVYIPFDTFNSSGASVTLTGLAVTDIEVYKDGSATQRASDSGYTLLDTDGIDFDGITGIHGFSIDLSDNSDAGFYAAGSHYWVIVSAVTIDSQAVSFVAATFDIGPAEVNVKQVSDDATAADNLELACDNYSATRGLSGTALPAAAADAAGGLPISDAGGLDLDTLFANIAAILVDTSTTLDNLVDDLEARIGVPSDLGGGATVSANLSDIEALLNSAQAEPTGVPAANETALVKIAYLFMVMRNQKTVTATKKTVFDDSGTAEFEYDLSDDGTTYTETEANAI